MAKRNKKKRAALFEVMAAGKSLEVPVTRSRRPLVQAPSWWTRWKLHRARMAEARALRAEQMASMSPVEIAPPHPAPRPPPIGPPVPQGIELVHRWSSRVVGQTGQALPAARAHLRHRGHDVCHACPVR